MAKSQTTTHSHQTFWGVISYVPVDLAWCEWLYFTLHGYPVPVALAGQVTHDGFGLPESLSVFPDPDDSSYDHGYAEALKTGRYLIVICSPNSAHSPKVDAHIRDFKRVGGDERIIVLVVEGEPNSGRREPTNGAWLPPWLRWRLDDRGRFQPADRSEPQIIDARPGRATLDEIMAALLAALMGISLSEFDAVSGPEPLAPQPIGEGLLEQDGMVDQIWAELASKKANHERAKNSPARPIATDRAEASHPPSAGTPRRNTGLIVGAGAAVLAAGGIALWLNAGKHEEASPKVADSTPQLLAPPPKPPGPRPIVSTPDLKESAADTPLVANEKSRAPLAAESSAGSPPVTASATTNPSTPPVQPAPTAESGTDLDSAPAIATAAGSPPLQQAPPSVSELAHSAGDPAASAVPPAPAATPPPSILSPDQVADQAAQAVLKDVTEKRGLADQLVRSGHVSEALPLYLKVLDGTERYAALRKGDPSAELETAKLCLIVGSLQSNYDSTAEARQTLMAGRRILQKMKGKGTDERSRVLNSLQEQIRRIDDDSPRRRAQQE